jgi:hypothetical protein
MASTFRWKANVSAFELRPAGNDLPPKGGSHTRLSFQVLKPEAVRSTTCNTSISISRQLFACKDSRP